MGCVSSKILTKSASFRDELNRSLRRRTNGGVDEIIITKNNGDQFLALLCTANAVAQRLKESSPALEPDGVKNPSAMIKNSNSNSVGAKEPDIETINTWELLDGLEDDNEGEEHQNAGNDLVGPSRSFRTVEDFDALVAAKDQSLERSEDIKKEAEEEGRLVRNDSREKGPKRKAMAKELTALKVPGFEFVGGGSLREWLSQGGQVFSPGSYITPKFGNFVSPGANNADNAIVFDPELVEQFERAMEQLTIEEEGILEEIIASFEGGNEESITFDIRS